MITREELQAKLDHLRAVLERRNVAAILLRSEGSLRWLTGTRHQIMDIAPDADSPVNALVRLRHGSIEVTFLTTRIEMPRICDQLPEIFHGIPEVSIDFRESISPTPDGTLLCGQDGYQEVVSEIVRPILGGLQGNQVRKLEWLYAMTVAVITETGLGLRAGMHGAEVRGQVFHSLASRDVESNLILVALIGQEKHLHSLYSSRYLTERGCWVKLVVGGRYAEIIVSTTAMIRIGSPPSRAEARVYAALQRACVEYADLYREGKSEAEIFTGVGERFKEVENDTGLKGFHRSAYLHHLGGPTSPLGNRDYIIDPQGSRRMFPWMQFAINPCETFYDTKVELQGIVMPEGTPHMLDGSRFVPKNLGLFTEIRARGGTAAMVANIVTATG